MVVSNLAIVKGQCSPANGTVFLQPGAVMESRTVKVPGPLPLRAQYRSEFSLKNPEALSILLIPDEAPQAVDPFTTEDHVTRPNCAVCKAGLNPVWKLPDILVDRFGMDK
ncbi:hypothetical protein IFM58399_08350 [Aspergillus lentulus]|uniref:Uncharacterized protein n=1 Tax=Aspergillus lentulus TaxID=293939 RepID=A0ABQ1AST7_ASPLE|nr:uncharacterized protein IFM58399_08350 [Aspergillus lentulus]KAF4158083.1 hypothetical protein CNMCM6069_004738 [Aspergillus lentulus]GFF48636.1 hypothetical protein IFM58399_08350 [Aspergillus lentulus]GFF69791.1 hypothetical protein IFM62136_07675 [Aspergillus lentulus]GFF87470.1 hypothetical protein IFM60648_08057 [Aspergillus lentulus]GFG06807.1 hypothetical protein IFM61392_04534 [Aspergillus lentulus]